MNDQDLVFFVSDLHGKLSRYDSLFSEIINSRPAVLLMGGDLLPHAHARGPGRLSAEEFAEEYLPKKFGQLKEKMGNDYPLVLLILGNDDPRFFEPLFIESEKKGLWKYLHMNWVDYKEFRFYGYSMIPPTPFQLKDWERFDVSRYTDPGCIPPNEGSRTVNPEVDIEHTSIQKELAALTDGHYLNKSIFLFHSPPYKGNLDRAALDGKMFENVPLDVHLGSIAIQRFIEEKQPLITLHGHIHESTRLTGYWSEQSGKTFSFNAATDSPELSIVKFYLQDPGTAKRVLL